MASAAVLHTPSSSLSLQRTQLPEVNPRVDEHGRATAANGALTSIRRQHYPLSGCNFTSPGFTRCCNPGVNAAATFLSRSGSLVILRREARYGLRNRRGTTVKALSNGKQTGTQLEEADAPNKQSLQITAEGVQPQRQKVQHSEKDELPYVSSSTKTCVQCGYTKSVVDFQTVRTVSNSLVGADLRMDACRACLAVLRAKSREAPLFHLAMSVEDAWENAKECRQCHQTKELRDFARRPSSKDGADRICRSCRFIDGKRRGVIPPSNDPKRCVACEEIKPASSFDISTRSPTGRRNFCKPCHAARAKERYERRKVAQPVLKIENKVCPSCKTRKPVEEYYLKEVSLDGLQPYCRQCTKAKEIQRKKARKQEAKDRSSEGAANEAADVVGLV